MTYGRCGGVPHPPFLKLFSRQVRTIRIPDGPTYFTAYNPLLGRTPVAGKTLLVGWGEGLAETAQFLNERPDSASEGTAAWYGHSVFGPFYRGRRYDLLYEVPSASSLYANDVDFVVTYINQEQRQLLDKSIQQLLSDEPINTEPGKVCLWPKCTRGLNPSTIPPT